MLFTAHGLRGWAPKYIPPILDVQYWGYISHNICATASFLWEELSFRYAGASADAPAYHFYREGFCSNRSVMLRRLMPRVERLCSMALVAGGRMPRAPRRMRAELKLSHPTKSSLRCVGGIFLLRETHLENFMSRPNVIPTFRQRRCTNRGRNFVRSKRRSTYTSSGTLYLFLRLNNSETSVKNTF